MYVGVVCGFLLHSILDMKEKGIFESLGLNNKFVYGGIHLSGKCIRIDNLSRQGVRKKVCNFCRDIDRFEMSFD